MKRIGIACIALLMYVTGLAGQEATTESPEFQILGPGFLALRVANAPDAAAWYRAAFSLETANEIDAPDGRYRIRILTSPSLTIELIEMQETAEPPARHLGLFKFGIFVDDIEAAFDWFGAAGVDRDDSIFVDEALSMRSFLMRDPEGNRLQVFARCVDSC